MQDKKQKKAKIQVIFLILISTLVILADFYAIINYPKEYMLIAAITVIFMICLWGVISGFFSLSALKEDRREEQYDSIFKSEKASYLMLRKYFDEIEGKIEILQKESKIPTEDIINAQKGIAKVVINRNKENADAIMNSNEQLMETFEHLENKLKESNDFIIESQKNVIYDNLKDIMEKQQVLSDSIKDMEIRLSQAISRELEKEDFDFYFVGAHPMAGREVSGYDNSLDNLFDNASFICTPTGNTPRYISDALVGLAQEMGFARTVVTCLLYTSPSPRD